MADTLKYILNDDTQITPTVDLNQWWKRMNTKSNELTNQNSLQSPKLLGQRTRKRYYNL